MRPSAANASGTQKRAARHVVRAKVFAAFRLLPCGPLPCGFCIDTLEYTLRSASATSETTAPTSAAHANVSSLVVASATPPRVRVRVRVKVRVRDRDRGP